MPDCRLYGILVATAVLVWSSMARAQKAPADEFMLGRVSEYVEQYYSRSQSILGRETISIQPLSRDLSSDGFARELVYDFRVEWTPSLEGAMPAANMVRQLLSVNGRPPKDGDEPKCLDPRAITPEPLGMLLRDRREKFIFTWTGPARVDGREAMRLDYRSRAPEPAEVSWREDCVEVNLPGRTRGRLWVDPATAEILRFDEGIIGMFEFTVPRKRQRIGGPGSMMVERADTSIRYKPVTFHDPDETLLLPASIDTLTVFRNAGAPHRTRQVYSNYRRFVTEGRLLR